MHPGSLDSLPGPRQPANGGAYERRGSAWWFVPNAEALQFPEGSPKCDARVSGIMCNPTPPFLPVLGGFTHPVTGESCWPVDSKGHAGLGEMGDSSKTALLVLGGAAVLALLGYIIYTRYKLEREIVKREGTSGMLKYEAGSAAIGLGAGLVGRAFDRNKRKRLRRRRA